MICVFECGLERVNIVIVNTEFPISFMMSSEQPLFSQTDILSDGISRDTNRTIIILDSRKGIKKNIECTIYQTFFLNAREDQKISLVPYIHET